MKLKYLLVTAAISISWLATAQLSPVGQSASFDEPDNGFAKILLLSNQNTAYVHIKTKGETEIKIYDRSHNEVASNENEMSYNNLKKGEVLGLFETRDGITAIISEYDDKGITLTKALFDKNSGRVISDEVLKSIPRPKKEIHMFWEMYYKADELAEKALMPQSFFKLVKAPEDLSYTILSCNVNDDAAKNIEVLHFDDANHLQSDTYLKPEDKIRKMLLLGACNGPDNTVSILVKGYYAASAKSKSLLKNAYFTSLTYDGTASKFVKMDYPGARSISDALMQYNPVSKQYIILAVKKAMKTSGKTKMWGKSDEATMDGINLNYNLFKTIYDAGTNTTQTAVFSSPMLSKAASVNYPVHSRFAFLPAEIIINSDGTYNLVCEGRLVTMSTYSTTSMGSNGTVKTGAKARYRLFRTDVGVVKYNADNTEAGAWYIPKSYLLYNRFEPSDFDYLNAGAGHLYMGMGFKSFYFLNDSHNSFVFMNDDIENGNRLEKKKKIADIQALENCVGYCFNVSGSDNFPKRAGLFTSDDGKRPICLFAASDYDQDSHTFVTLKLDRSHQKQGVQIVWYKLD